MVELKKIFVRYLRPRGSQARQLRETIVELQALSILRAGAAAAPARNCGKSLLDLSGDMKLNVTDIKPAHPSEH